MDQQQIAERIGDTTRFPDAGRPTPPEANVRELQTVSPQGHRYLLRDDGVAYGWNPRLAWNPRFRAITAMPAEVVAMQKEAERKRQSIAIGFKQQLAAQEEALVRMRAEAAARLRDAQNPVISAEEAAQAQGEDEQPTIMSGSAEKLREFALQHFNVFLPLGDADLMRNAVLALWDRSVTHWVVGEPADWRSLKLIKDFLANKLFVRVPADIRVEEARTLARQHLDAYQQECATVGNTVDTGR